MSKVIFSLLPSILAISLLINNRHVGLTVQASGVVRFFHGKHQCYVVGKGSFAGRFGCLPDIDDAEEEDVDSGPKSTTPSSPGIFTLMEPPVEKGGKAGSRTSVMFVNSTTLRPNHTRKPSVINACPDDEVILEDGTYNMSSCLFIIYNHVSVHFRRKKKTGGLSNVPSTSPNTFWQIEKYSEPCSGEKNINIQL